MKSIRVSQLFDSFNYSHIKDSITDELRKAAKYQTSSVSFVKNKLPNKPLLTNGLVQGLAIGGTNYSEKTVEIKANEEINSTIPTAGNLPIFSTKQTLVDFLINHMNPKADAIGINFGYPIEPVEGSYGEIDSKLFRATKEHTFLDVTMPIGSLAKEVFHQKYGKKIPISVANDTICLTLADKKHAQGSVIAGTGFNMAVRYSESAETFIVNLEIGNFDKFIHSESLLNIDQHSEHQKQQLLEKSVSGRYLFEHFNYYIRTLELGTVPLHSSQELSALAHNSIDEPDKILARKIIEHSAKLAAAAIAGVYTFSKSPEKYRLIGDGSLLWNGWHYQEIIKKQLQEFGISRNTIEIKHIQDVAILGAIGLITAT